MCGRRVGPLLAVSGQAAEEKCVYTDGRAPGESSGRGSEPALCLPAPTSCSEREKAQDPISVPHNRVDLKSSTCGKKKEQEEDGNRTSHAVKFHTGEKDRERN